MLSHQLPTPSLQFSETLLEKERPCKLKYALHSPIISVNAFLYENVNTAKWSHTPGVPARFHRQNQINSYGPTCASPWEGGTHELKEQGLDSSSVLHKAIPEGKVGGEVRGHEYEAGSPHIFFMIFFQDVSSLSFLL